MGCSMCPDIHAAPAVINRAAELRHGLGVGDVHGRKCCLPALGLDAVIKFFQSACCAPDSDDMMSFAKGFGKGCSKPARRAGNKGDFICHISNFRGVLSDIFTQRPSSQSLLRPCLQARQGTHQRSRRRNIVDNSCCGLRPRQRRGKARLER